MIDQNYLDAIKQFEGFSSKSRWDYAQNTNGYGTKAQYAGEVIDKTEADRRFSQAINKAADVVDKFAPNLDEGSKAALTSLTYNAGSAWTESGLGAAVASGDMDKARSIFLEYNKAGGNVLDGLVQRRLQEATWFGGSGEPSAASATAQPAAAQVVASSETPVVTAPAQASAPARVADAGISQQSASADTRRAVAGLDADSLLLEVMLRTKQGAVPSDKDGTRTTVATARTAI